MNEIKYFVKAAPDDWLNPIERGWGNGYVVLPPGHPWHGVDYDEINVDVHGGLTFSRAANNLSWAEIEPDWLDGWVIGWDTAHFDDSLEEWPKERVIEQTLYLLQQCENA